jgi:hypothetical protein
MPTFPHFHSSHEKANKCVQTFMQVHAKRITTEAELAVVNHEGEIPEKIKYFANALVAEILALQKIQRKNFNTKYIDLKALSDLHQQHHPSLHTLAKVGIHQQIPIFSGDPDDSDRFTRALFQFISQNRQQQLFDQACDAHTVRLQLEKGLATCSTEEIKAHCENIFDAMLKEFDAKEAYDIYITYGTNEKMRYHWNYFDNQFHASELLALQSDRNLLPKLPLPKKLQSSEYAEKLEQFMIACRLAAPKAQTAPTVPAGITTNQSKVTHPPMEQTPQQRSLYDKILKHPITHMLATIGISASIVSTWSTIALSGLCAVMLSLSFQMARHRLIEHWIKQALLQKSQLTENTWAESGYRKGYASEKSYKAYLIGWFQPAAYFLPSYYLGRYTAKQNTPIESRLTTPINSSEMITQPPSTRNSVEITNTLHPFKM